MLQFNLMWDDNFYQESIRGRKGSLRLHLIKWQDQYGIKLIIEETWTNVYVDFVKPSDESWFLLTWKSFGPEGSYTPKKINRAKIKTSGEPNPW